MLWRFGRYLSLAAVLALPSAGWGTVIFNDFTIPYNCCGGYGVTALPLAEEAFAFTPGISAIFSELDIAIGASTGANSAIVQLMSDSSGAPGAVLESWTVSSVQPPAALWKNYCRT